MSITVRPSTRADLAAIDALLARSYPKLLKADYPPSVLVTALPLISRANPRLVTCGTYYVADEAGAILGAGGWTPDGKDKLRGHIRHLVTDDRHLRRGIGRALIGHSLAVARDAGVRRMECWSTLTAERFYQSLGFRTLGPMEVQLAGGISFPSLRMMLDLPPGDAPTQKGPVE